MAIFYFKKVFILLLIIFAPQLVSAQTDSNKTKKFSSKIDTTNASSSTKVKLRLDSQKRAYFIDPQGDKIIILDYKTRKTLQETSQYKKAVPLSTMPDSKSFYKKTTPDIIEEVAIKFDTYTSKEGDTWESISLKLYDTETQWPQLKLWNEELLTELIIPEGSTIKYKKIPKN